MCKARTNLGKPNKTGEYIRHDSKHRPKLDSIVPEKGRYHLHISLACPWAAGALTMLRLKGLEDAISYSIVHPTWVRTKPDDDSDSHCGWVYRKPGDAPLANPKGFGSYPCDDALVPFPANTLREVYERYGDFDGPFTTPLLVDTKNNLIVSNESMDILRILNFTFDSIATKNKVIAAETDGPQRKKRKHASGIIHNLYPTGDVGAELDALNERLVYPKVNNGVYRSGFAKSQKAYEAAVRTLFEGLEELEGRLEKTRFLSGSTFTWLDLRLYHTLVRFDPVYTCYFKTNAKRIADYPNLLGFVRDVYQSIPAVRESTNLAHIKTHYYSSHPTLNLYGIIPISNGPDLTVPHGRAHK
jgi:putative glutathione S-transferase